MSKPESLTHQSDDRPNPRNFLMERATGAVGPTLPLESRPAEPEPESDELDLRELWQVIIKRRRTILIFILIMMIAVVTATFLMTPIYRASLTLQIDREDIRIVDIKEMAPVDASTSTQDYYQTQFELLKSRTLAKRVINQLGLADLPPPPPSQFAEIKTSISDWIVGWLPQSDPEDNPKPLSTEDNPKILSGADRMEGFISGFLGRLTVAPVRNSRLVKLFYDSPDPKLAAAILNALVKNYINMNLERRFDASTYARNFLQERLQQVKIKLEESERELIKFARQEQIITTDDKQSIVSQNLASISAALIEAEKKRFAAEVNYRQVLSTRGQGLTQMLENPMIQSLKASQNNLEAQYQNNLNLYKPSYPSMLQLRSQINQIGAMINLEMGNIRSAITAQYEAAKAEETLLRARVNELKQETLALQDRSIQFNILRRELDTNRQLYDGLLQRFKEVGVAAGIGANNISVVDEAKSPLYPYKPNLHQNVLLALVLGLLGGIGLAFLFENLDDTFRRPEELEKKLGLPVLGVIPRIRQERGDRRTLALVSLDDPRSAFAEAYRSVRTSLQFSTSSGVPRLLTVTSAMSGEGKTTTVLSLAIQFAQAGKRTLLIESDLRKPSLHRALNLDNQIGLTNYLAGGSFDPADIARPTHIPNLFVIPSGPLPPNPVELLGSARMIELLTLAAEKFDQVLVDSPPLLGLADALILGNLCEGTLLTVEMGGTPRGYVLGALKRLRNTRVHVLGCILTKLEARSGAYGYYRSYYNYQSSYGDTPADPKKLSAA